MSDDFDFREVTDDEKVDIVDDGTRGEKSDTVSGEVVDKKDDADKNENKSEFEDVCFVCRRPESKAGKMYHLPNNICICEDCMHKTMDAVSQFDYQNMLNNPGLMKRPFPSFPSNWSMKANGW